MADWDIKGKVCLVTGGNAGIGRETALLLLKQGAGRVILACRNMTTGAEAVAYLRQEAGITDDDEAAKRIVLKNLDLGSLESVRKLAATINAEEKQLHVLIGNAGVYAEANRSETVDGFEISFGTNHLGHFLLTNLLLDLIKRSAPARIVIVASVAYKFCWPWGFHIDDPNYEKSWYESWLAYSHSKLANILFTRTLDQKLNAKKDSGVTCYSLHPGAVKTGLLLRNRSWLMQWLVSPMRWFFVTPTEGAATTIHCATQPGIEKYSGRYFQNSQVYDTWAMATDDNVANKLWDLSEDLIEAKRKK